MTNEKKTNTPLIICIIAFVLGMVIAALGWIKEDCIGPNCWVGSGAIKWSGIVIGIIGLGGMAIIGGRKTN
jgi:hypothetical protein